MSQSSLHPSCFRPRTSPTCYCRWPINGKAFSHVSRKTEQAGGFLLPTGESSHSGRAMDGFQLRLKVKYFYLSFLRPHGGQRLLPTLGRLKFHRKRYWSEPSDNTHQGPLGKIHKTYSDSVDASIVGHHGQLHLWLLHLLFIITFFFAAFFILFSLLCSMKVKHAHDEKSGQ